MHLVTCEHPRFIKNPYTGNMVQVSCGHCNTCQNSKAFAWATRLIDESKLYPNQGLFVLLTYADYYLPKYDYNEETDCYEEISNPIQFAKTLPNGQIVGQEYKRNMPSIPRADLEEYIKDPATEEYLKSRLAHPLRLPVACKRDIQLFNKRLNSYIKRHYSGHYGNIRFFAVAEYGPTTFRGHYHFEIWSRCSEFLCNAESIISALWPFGDVSVRYIGSHEGAGNYIAEYLNCTTHLPSLYKHPALRPFHLCSRRPPIGDLKREEVEKIVNESACTIVRPRKDDSGIARFVDIPVPQSVRDRLFPKCLRFSEISSSDRVLLYGFTRYFPKTKFWQFYGIMDEFYKYAHYYPSEVHQLHSYLSAETNGFSPSSINKLRSIFYTSRRVVSLAAEFNLSLTNYVRHIENFYANQQLYKLNQGLSWLADYSASYPMQEWLNYYLMDFKDWEKNGSTQFTRAFGLIVPSDYERSEDFVAMSSKSKYVRECNTKTMKLNAYRYLMYQCKDRQLANIVLRYKDKCKEYE